MHTLTVLLSVLVVLTPPVFAADLGDPAQFVKAMDTQGMLEKLGRGASNTLLGWVEIPHQIDVQLRASGMNAVGASAMGLAKGTVLGIRRTAVGLYEVVTFWAPVPAHYAPVIPDADYTPPP